MMPLRSRPRWRGARAHTHGLTLVELLVVITLIGLLMSAIGIAVFYRFREGQKDAANIACTSLRASAQSYAVRHAEESECPTPAKLKVSRELDATTSLTDPWGTLYRIECEPEEVIAVSAGPDRVFGNADDIRVPGARHLAGVATHP